MSEPAEGKVNALYRYPVKGLTAEAMATVRLEREATMPCDRVYAIENGASLFNPEHPAHLPKVHFLMLMRNEQLAALDCRYDDATHTLRVFRGSTVAASGDLRTAEGRANIEEFLNSYVPATALRGWPRIVHSAGHSFSDVAAKCVHVINLESVRSLATVLGMDLDLRRFRANVIVEGPPAWSELDWIGKVLEFSDGLKAEVFKRTERCAATNVNPATGARDLKIPSLLSRTLGHTDFGVYARIIAPGALFPGQTFAVR